MIGGQIVASRAEVTADRTDRAVRETMQLATHGSGDVGCEDDVGQVVERVIGVEDIGWALILPGLISAFNMIIVRNFFMKGVSI